MHHPYTCRHGWSWAGGACPKCVHPGTPIDPAEPPELDHHLERELARLGVGTQPVTIHRDVLEQLFDSAMLLIDAHHLTTDQPARQAWWSRRDTLLDELARVLECSRPQASSHGAGPAEGGPSNPTEQSEGGSA